MYTVTISERGKPPVKLDFDKPEITIGRVRGNDIVLQKNNVSKRHAKLLVKDSQFIIIDQKSTNGTIVNARKITAPQVIREEDKICIGDLSLTLVQQAAQASPEAKRATSPAPPPPGPIPTAVPNAPPAGPPPRPQEPDLPSILAEVQPAAAPPEFSPQPASPPAPAGPPPVAPAPVGPPPVAPLPAAPAPVGPPPSLGAPIGPPPSAPAPMAPPPSTPEPVAAPPIMAEPLSGPPPAAVPSIPPTPAAEPEVPEDAPTFDSEEEYAAAAPVPSAPPFGSTATPAVSVPSLGSAPSLTPSPDTDGAAGEKGSTLSGFASAADISAARQPDSSPFEKNLTEPAAMRLSSGGSDSVGRGALSSTNPGLTEASSSFDDLQARAMAKAMEGAEQAHESYPPEAATLADAERRVDRILDQLAADGTLSGIDRETLMSLVTLELVGLGPIEFFLDDPTIDLIHVNAADQIFVRRKGKIERAPHRFSNNETLAMAAARITSVGRKIDDSLVSLRLSGGEQIDLVLPPAAVGGPVISVEKPPAANRSLDELVSGGVLSDAARALLGEALRAKRSVLIVGPSKSGKTELLEALANALPAESRLVAVEEKSSLTIKGDDVVRLESRNIAQPGNLIRHALRLSPSCLIVDAVGIGNAHDWLLGTAFSAAGSGATIDGFGARDGLGRLESMAVTLGLTNSPRSVRQLITHAVDFAVGLGTTADGGWRVTEVVEVQGLELDTLRLQDVFFCQVGANGDAGTLQPTGHVPAFYEDLRRAGAEPDVSIFRS